MSEFNNRMAAQRYIVHLVNDNMKGKEQLFGLSRQALDRWILANGIDASSRLVVLIRGVAGKIVCLATKSQEQISEDYRMMTRDVEILTRQIETEIC